MSTSKDSPQLTGSFELFKPSFDAVKINFWTFFWLAFVPGFMSVIASLQMSNSLKFGTETQTQNSFALGIPSEFIGLIILSVVISLLVAPALVYLELQSGRGKKVSVSEALENGFKYLPAFIGLSLLVGLLVFGGLLLLVVPGLIMLRRYFLAPYYLIDQNLTIKEAMQKSQESSKPYSGSIWGLIGVNIVLSLANIIPGGIGALTSLVLTLLYSVASALRYDEITQTHNLSKAPISHTK